MARPHKYLAELERLADKTYNRFTIARSRRRWDSCEIGLAYGASGRTARANRSRRARGFGTGIDVPRVELGQVS